MGEENDKKLGYGVMIFLGIIIAATATHLALKLRAPLHLRTIVFKKANSLNFLRMQDPVKIRGVEVGMVRGITRQKGETHVEIQTRQFLDIHKGYYIIAQANGFMGDRYCAVESGPSNTPAIGATELLYGTFPMGPAEIIAYSGQLRRIVDSISGLVAQLRTGSTGRLPVETRFTHVMMKCDSITRSLTALLRAADRFAMDNADSLSALIGKTAGMSNSLSSSVPGAMTTIETITAKTGRLLTIADSLLASTDALVCRMSGKDAAELSGRLDELKRNVTLLKDGVQGLRDGGYKLRFKLGNK